MKCIHFDLYNIFYIIRSELLLAKFDLWRSTGNFLQQRQQNHWVCINRYVIFAN